MMQFQARVYLILQPMKGELTKAVDNLKLPTVQLSRNRKGKNMMEDVRCNRSITQDHSKCGKCQFWFKI